MLQASESVWRENERFGQRRRRRATGVDGGEQVAGWRAGGKGFQTPTSGTAKSGAPDTSVARPPGRCPVEGAFFLLARPKGFFLYEGSDEGSDDKEEELPRARVERELGATRAAWSWC